MDISDQYISWSFLGWWRPTGLVHIADFVFVKIFIFKGYRIFRWILTYDATIYLFKLVFRGPPPPRRKIVWVVCLMAFVSKSSLFKESHNFRIFMGTWWTRYSNKQETDRQTDKYVQRKRTILCRQLERGIGFSSLDSLPFPRTTNYFFFSKFCVRFASFVHRFIYFLLV